MIERENKFKALSNNNAKEQSGSNSSQERRIPERKPSITNGSILKNQIKAFSSLTESFANLK